VVCDLALEGLLTAARRALLGAAETGAVSDAVLRFASALARQCYINEYVYAVGDEELARVKALRGAIAAMVGIGKSASPIQIAPPPPAPHPSGVAAAPGAGAGRRAARPPAPGPTSRGRLPRHHPARHADQGRGVAARAAAVRADPLPARDLGPAIPQVRLDR